MIKTKQAADNGPKMSVDAGRERAGAMEPLALQVVPLIPPTLHDDSRLDDGIFPDPLTEELPPQARDTAPVAEATRAVLK